MQLSGTTPLDQAVLDYKSAKDKLAQAEAVLALAKDNLVYQLELANAKSHVYDGYQATVVKTSSYAWNETGLKKALGARVFNKLTTAKLDKKKLEAALVSGEIDPRVAAAHAVEKEGAAFIRFTEKKS